MASSIAYNYTKSNIKDADYEKVCGCKFGLDYEVCWHCYPVLGVNYITLIYLHPDCCQKHSLTTTNLPLALN